MFRIYFFQVARSDGYLSMDSFYLYPFWVITHWTGVILGILPAPSTRLGKIYTVVNFTIRVHSYMNV